MSGPSQNIKTIISQSNYFFEALSKKDNQILEVDDSVNELLAQQRLAEWLKVVAPEEEEQFKNRLQWSDWDIPQVLKLLGTRLDNQIWPAWADTLTELIEQVSQISLSNVYPSPIELENPLPFQDVILPLVVFARFKLLAHLGTNGLSPEELPLKLMSESAYLKLERSLFQRLLQFTGKTLDYEFSHSKPIGQILLNLVIQKPQSSQVKYNAFVEKILDDGLLAFFLKYPVLGRLVSTIIDFWVEATAEFLERLNADLPLTQETFQAENINLGKVIEISTSLSDAHNRGRSVIALTFESGLKLIYKPRNLGVEVAFNQLLAWCNQQLSQEGTFENNLLLKFFKVLNRGTHGWAEYIDQQPCKDEAAARRFYMRAGMLLCLLYVLGATDCHNENVIANGEHLVLVDLETILQHEAKLVEDVEKTAILEATNQLTNSVLRTGFLPMWEFGADDSIACDFSALGSVEAQPVLMPMPVWKFVNTDDMYLGYETINRPLAANVSILNGIALSPNDYLPQLHAGFERMYRFLMKYRDNLLSTDSPLRAFHSVQLRFIVRATKVYAKILGRTLQPKFFKNGIDWSIQLDFLSRAFLTKEKPHDWLILAEELKQLSQGDIPYFQATATRDTLVLDSGELDNYFQESCCEQVQRRLENLSEADYIQQAEMIQLAFHARVAQTIQTIPANLSIESEDYGYDAILTAQELINEAERIANQIKGRSISGSDGSLSWIALSYIPTAERFQLQPLSASFYDGNAGIALFFAALAFVKGNSQFADLALRSIQPIRQILSGADREQALSWAKKLGIGGATGVGSLVYCLLKLRQFLNLPELCEDSLLASKLITPEAIASDSNCDIMSGSAGTILGLLALHEETGESEVLQQAQACGHHLAKYSHSVYSNRKTARPQTGFSHGASGIAYALVRLYGVTKNIVYLEAALEAQTYESKVFSPTAGNWPIIPRNSNLNAPLVFWNTWCYGAPGVALGRLGSLSIYQTPEMLADVEVALKTTKNSALQVIDHYCCGNIGRAEVLLVASIKLSNPHWRQAAQQVATQVVQRAAQTGSYQLFTNLPTSVFSPCFFQGISGIGYQLLRLAHPELVPSVLLWN
ncbi:type 2 lanthipeptide synthetase LanM family protein [Aetokthonos hydrillicola Thurmond2011]|jgi:type 2 lantibiotic biosynthesis protein LanM|uniref:Type 2 lanthipeptide synthetase LanM family protein n=1 Tax=Aetokthonos hydrillicola Thurmond2011 TaxID=2712845 RepID=A0AAP5M9C4_9CYAN|nr:type 2 lanthipeptide synthetase LanM family protein [Aetokthonos hydrillicola]MBO3458567.1 type 2 lantipeptide synthetase LanM [Aetokthonos hydrillicola CCALA 1050]MBW4585010.1 type 2 lantipeptide synthetase LanM family protein [Aetokthonos hydrillicola CCALA 1050]MDR9894229.1 type 2 lanthipeptide synthetase LanM family protein [Aetokthonos hydrillicola Thurmond2011]